MNVLLMPVIRIFDSKSNETIFKLTLPGVLARMMKDEVSSFPALRSHQRHAWHSFLVLLTANGMHRANITEPPETEVAWCEILRGLTVEHPDDAPWCLIAPPDRPALLQPPIPSGNLAELKNEISTPDQLDMLVTAKNHDLKQAVMTDAQPDDWLFALLTLQTMEGFLGSGNYGISRMNGGFANRASLGIAPPGGPGAQLRRDLNLLLYRRGKLRGAAGYAAEGGLALVWLPPWDGTVSLRRDVLDEWYIEICRRVRLTLHDGVIAARAGGSKVARIVSIEGGVTGDPWSPIVVEKDGGTKSLTVDSRGFSYRRMVELMFPEEGGVLPSLLQEADGTDVPEGLHLVARALVRGQGKTEGYHERRVGLSRRVRRGFKERATDPIGHVARERTRLAGEMQDRVLKPALLSLFQNGPAHGDIDYRNKDSNRKAEVFLKRFDAVVDKTFFEDLWRETDADDPDAQGRARTDWVRELLRRAEEQLLEAEAGAARSSRRRFRSCVRAADRLHGAVYRNEHLKPHFSKDKPHEPA